MNEWLMRMMLCEYVALAGWFTFHPQGYWGLYWWGASILQFAVWRGMR